MGHCTLSDEGKKSMRNISYVTTKFLCDFAISNNILHNPMIAFSGWCSIKATIKFLTSCWDELSLYLGRVNWITLHIPFTTFSLSPKTKLLLSNIQRCTSNVQLSWTGNMSITLSITSLRPLELAVCIL